MQPSSGTFPHAIYRHACAAFAAFADASAHSALWADVLDRATPLAELPEGDFVATRPLLMRDPATLARALEIAARRLGGPWAASLSAGDHAGETPAEELWRHAAALDEPARLATDVLLRRAINPFEALATWPLEALFNPEEAAWLRAADRPTGPARVVPVAWQPGHDMDYRGYTCVIVKFTRLCNLRCTYCHDWRAGVGHTMPFSVQANLFQKLLGAADHRVVDVVWHGGEATLLGRRGFLRALALQRWFQRPGQQIRNRVQTNATRIDDAWVRFFRRYRIDVGASLDGPAEIHDRTRPHVSGRSTFAEARRGLRLLQEANLLSHVYLVIGDELMALGGEAVVRFLQEEGLTEVGMLAVRPSSGPESTGEAYLSPADSVRFLLDVHRARQAHPEPWIAVRELDTALRAARGESPGFCELVGNCVGAFFSIEPDGSVGHCDKYIGDPRYTLGNILHQDFDEIRAGERAQRLIAENAAATEPQRESCPYFTYCRGWCPHERYIADRDDPGHDPACCGLAGLFEALTAEVDHRAAVPA